MARYSRRHEDAARRYRLGLLLVTLSAIAWSTAGLFTRLIPLDAWTILFWRGLFGGLAVSVFIATRDGRGFWRAFAEMGPRGALYCLCSTGGMVSFLSALKHTTVARVAIIYATVPFVTAALAWVVMRERASPSTLLASVVAVLGVLLIVVGGPAEGGLAGDALAILMTLFLAAMTVTGRATQASPLVPAACLSSLLGAILSLPMASPWSAGAFDLLNLVLFGITSMGFGLIFFTIGARHIPAAQTALIGALDTPLAPLWVWLGFGETPRLRTLAGGAIVLVAVLGNIAAEFARHRSRSGRGSDDRAGAPVSPPD